MANLQGDSRAKARDDFRRGWRLIIPGFILTWLAGLAFVLEVINLLFFKKLLPGSDSSAEMVIAVFCLLLASLGAVLAWRGARDVRGEPPARVDKTINRMILGLVLGVIFTFIVGVIILSANRYFLSQQSNYVRAAPRPNYNMPPFPQPSFGPTPTIDPSNKYLSGSLIGSTDHLQVGNVWISVTPDDQTVNYVEITVQAVECIALQAGKPVVLAVGDSIPIIKGPLQVNGGRFYASQNMGMVYGSFVSTDEAQGIVYLKYVDPASGQSCDLGTYEYDAFTVENK